MSTLAENLAAILARIETIARKHGRKAGEIQLVAVSKTNPPEAIREVFAAGQRAFGESRVQEALRAAAGNRVALHRTFADE